MARRTREEIEAARKAYEEERARKKAEREAKRKARIEAYEKRRELREQKKRGVRPATAHESSAVGQVQRQAAFQGKVEKGDLVAFRFLGMMLAGYVVEHVQEKHFRNVVEGEEEQGMGRFQDIDYYTVKEYHDGTMYPVRKNNILAKKVGKTWKEKESKSN